MFKMIRYLLLIITAALLTACGSDQSTSSVVNTQSGSGSDVPNVAFPMPERIRTSQAVDLDATSAMLSTSAGPVTLMRNGNQFEGSIEVAQGSNFTFSLSIFEQVDGEDIQLATFNDEIDAPINTDLDIIINASAFSFPDDDGDGFSNLVEREAGSNHALSFSTPDNPDGMPPVESSPGFLQFSTDSFSVAEDDGEITIVVTRTGGTDGLVTVNYNLSSVTAVAGQDFQSTAGQLVFADGDATPQTFQVIILADDISDGEHTFTTQLFSPTGGVGITNGVATITIFDSTPPPERGTIQFASNNFSIDEDAGQLSLEVERVNGTDGPVSVELVTEEGTATANEDFVPITNPQTIQFADGESGTKTVQLQLINDSIAEPTETLTAELSNSLGGAEIGLATATITITDADITVVPDLVPGTLSFAANGAVVSEGNSIDIAVERLGGTDGAVSVDYVVTTDTASEDDISPLSGTLNWIDGDSEPQIITLFAAEDALLEPTELFVINLMDPTGGATLDDTSISVTITNTAPTSPGVLSFSNADVSVDEGDSVEIIVSRTGGSSGPASASVTAPASDEYSFSPALLTWIDGDSTDRIITFSAAADGTTGDDQTTTLQLDNVEGATAGTDTIAVTINDTSTPGFAALATDGEWEVCFPPFNTAGQISAFATQLSAIEGRTVTCIKTCPTVAILDPQFPGWGFSPAGGNSCRASDDAPGTITNVPIYTPQREVINLDLNPDTFIGDNSIWACATETRQNAETPYITDTSATTWYQFLDDRTYLFVTTPGTEQPADVLFETAVWSAEGRVLELSHLETGFRNTLFFPANQTLHIHPDTDMRWSCTREERIDPALAVQ